MAKNKKKEAPEFNLKECNSCVVCIDTCPVDCLTMTVARGLVEGHKYPQLSIETACIGCGACAEDCPVDAITMVPKAA